MDKAASRIKFWIVKGNRNYPTPWDRRNGQLRDILTRPIDEMNWGTRRRIPDEFHKGDKIFYWSSSPDCFVIGLGVVINHDLGSDGNFNLFRLRHYSFQLSGYANICRLRERLPALPGGRMASFLVPAVVQTIYPLTQAQAECLAKLIVENQDDQQLAERTLQEWGLL